MHYLIKVSQPLHYHPILHIRKQRRREVEKEVRFQGMTKRSVWKTCQFCYGISEDWLYARHWARHSFPHYVLEEIKAQTPDWLVQGARLGTAELSVTPIFHRPLSWPKGLLEKHVNEAQAEDSGAQKWGNALFGKRGWASRRWGNLSRWWEVERVWSWRWR